MAQMELTGKKKGKSREMAIKYIFADVDGTLGIGGIGIPEKNRLAIRKYVEEGGSIGVQGVQTRLKRNFRFESK